ncbi:hypothetical protein [Aquimarina pacifica]|uniref:hypothetical protein n=1 Tax=Aquimarina pacifica TaxID=1296415 RepID=UPI000472F53B|nr:hypothetical protein [Aquimarina pacifica]
MKTQNKLRSRWILLLLILIAFGCSKDDQNEDSTISDTDEETIDQQPQPSIIEGDLKPEGVITETDNGFIVDGSLTVTTGTDDIIFEEANLEVVLDDEGAVQSIEGTALLPPPPTISMEDPVKTTVGFYTGAYINENVDIEILLKEDISYFVFNLEVDIELNLVINEEPHSIKPPLGGHITFIADYEDPMFFWSVGQDLLGSLAFGQSIKGQIPFTPITPGANNITFDAKKVRGGSMKFKKFLKGKGKAKTALGETLKGTAMLYENNPTGIAIDWENPLGSDLTLGYYAGYNGILELDVPLFGFEIGRGSCAIVTEASSGDKIIAKAFFTGIVDPDLSWWPELIPLKPDGMLSIDGYVDVNESFDFGMKGSFGIEIPGDNQKVEGELRVTNKAFTMQGKVIKNDEEWQAKATFQEHRTEYIATPPEGFLSGVSDIVGRKVDSTFAVTEQAIEELVEATENYEFELSLRGLREILPNVISYSRNKIDESVEQGIKDGRSEANAILSNYGLALCSDNIETVVTGIVSPYKDALTKLENAIAITNDTELTRSKIADALKELADLSKIDRTEKITITSGNKPAFLIPKCTVYKRTDTRNVNIKLTVLTQNQVDQLNEAAANIKYIGETSNIMISAQEVVNRLPSLEQLEHLRNNINSCVSDIVDNIGDVGFIKDHNTGEYTYFIMINGERTEVSGFDIFDSGSVIEIAMPEFNHCQTELDALNN